MNNSSLSSDLTCVPLSFPLLKTLFGKQDRSCIHVPNIRCLFMSISQLNVLPQSVQRTSPGVHVIWCFFMYVLYEKLAPQVSQLKGFLTPVECISMWSSKFEFSLKDFPHSSHVLLPFFLFNQILDQFFLPNSFVLSMPWHVPSWFALVNNVKNSIGHIRHL